MMVLRQTAVVHVKNTYGFTKTACVPVHWMVYIVYCDPSKVVFLYSQSCMAINQNLGEEVVGRCPYTYSLFMDPNVPNIGLYLKLPNNVDHLETTLCSRLNREGFFCGNCKENYSYPMYPDFMACVECNPRYHARNWILYILISYGPLTAFLMLVLCLRISATSASMNAFIFIAQVMSHPPFQRGFNRTIDTSYLSKTCGAVAFMRFLHSLYGLWNLDFFTSLIPEFCLPNLKVHGMHHCINLHHSLLPTAIIDFDLRSC